MDKKEKLKIMTAEVEQLRAEIEAEDENVFSQQFKEIQSCLEAGDFLLDEAGDQWATYYRNTEDFEQWVDIDIDGSSVVSLIYSGMPLDEWTKIFKTLSELNEFICSGEIDVFPTKKRFTFTYQEEGFDLESFKESFLCEVRYRELNDSTLDSFITIEPIK